MIVSCTQRVDKGTEECWARPSCRKRARARVGADAVGLAIGDCKRHGDGLPHLSACEELFIYDFCCAGSAKCRMGFAG
jgi:hypothetical protein